MIEGLGAGVLECLFRLEAIPSARLSGLRNRPSIRKHLDTMRAELPRLGMPGKITLIDDVVTKGRQLIAAAEVLRREAPECDVVAFAVSRTKGFVDDIPAVVDPCIGTIWRTAPNGDAIRSP